MRDAKLRAAVARSTCRSQNAKKYLNIGTLLDVELLKKRTPLWREAHLEVKMIKTLHVRTTFEMMGKCRALWREAHFQVKMPKTLQVQGTFGR